MSHLAELAHLRTFLAVYRAGSLSRAAHGLHLSQPAISAHLKLIERELGRPLFVRLARGVSPTPHGHALAREVAPHLDALDAIVRTIDGPFAGAVHLGGPADLLATRALPALVPLLHRGLRLRARTGLTDELLDALADGALDLVVATQRRRRRDLDFTPLFDEALLLVAAPRWAAQIGNDAVASTGADALRGAPLVAFAEGLPLVRRFFRTVFGQSVRATATLIVDDLRAVHEAVAAGAGVTVLPGYLVAEALSRGELVELHRPARLPVNTVFIAARAGATDPEITAVAQALQAAAPEWERR
jgi:DNA-binding transcriptional LysR family regulator